MRSPGRPLLGGVPWFLHRWRADRSDSPRSARPTWHSLRTGRRRGVMLHVVHVLSGFHTPLCRGCRHIYDHMVPPCMPISKLSIFKVPKDPPAPSAAAVPGSFSSKCSKSTKQRSHAEIADELTHPCHTFISMHFYPFDPPRSPQAGEVSSALYFMDSKIQKLTFKHEDAPSASDLPARPTSRLAVERVMGRWFCGC